jgi:hemerythrin superfamily protein
MSAARATANHETIRTWVEQRGGSPAHVKSTARGDDPGILRIDFPGYSGKDTLEKLSWDSFFEWFENNELAFLYQPDNESRFNKLVSRDNVQLEEGRAQRGSRVEQRGRYHAIKILEQQHREVEGMFDHYESATSDQEKVAAFELIADALAAHSRIEEEIFYPEIYSDDTEGALREAVEEHLAVKRVIADLLDMEASDPQFDAKMTFMKELVEHHVEEEEEELFDMLDDISEEAFTSMGRQMCDLYREIIDEEPRMSVPEETEAAAPL